MADIQKNQLSDEINASLALADSALQSVDLTSDVTGTLPIENGGTNATTASDARTNLSILDGELFKYQIVTSVSSGNLTVALKNYLGDDPSVAVPVKVQIGDTVRTITSALSLTMNSGTNFLNSGGAELANKEIDYFFLFVYNTSSGNIVPMITRVPSINQYGELTASNTVEKGRFTNLTIVGAVSTDPVTNIGRFNATLSASPYNWSIPATSVILNRPVYETRWLDAALRVYGETGSAGSYAESNMSKKYKIKGDTLLLKHRGRVTNVGSWTGDLRTSLPFSPKETNSFDQNIGQIVAQGSITQRAIANIISTSGYIEFTSTFATDQFAYSSLNNSNWIAINCYFEI